MIDVREENIYVLDKVFSDRHWAVQLLKQNLLDRPLKQNYLDKA